nr:pentatricopeptide repeat-containing protein At4g04790, mitochondrial-like isoform X1 [Ipomoea batatas]
MDVTPSSAQCEKLINFSCELLKVHIALDVVDQMYEHGLALSIDAFNLILGACEESCEYNLVRRMHSIISCYNLKPNSASFRMMINLSVKMKDFEGAYNLISDLQKSQKFNLMPTASMYNAIMVGYFREKNIRGGLMVLKQMEDAEVKPDSQTFSYLIRNCNCEDDIIKFYDELTLSGVQVTKHVYMALINAYASCGQFEKAKQVILDKGIPVKNLNEVKSMLVSALAAHGQVSDALEVYEKIKQAKCNLDPRAVSCLIDHLQSEGEFNRLLQLLDELDERNHWIGACFKVISYCIRHEDLRSVIELLKKLKDMFNDDEVAREVLFDEVFCRIAEKEPRTMHFGWNLLQAFKKDIGLRPSRKCLDFLLSACISAKDLPTCFKIWKEYIEAGLPRNSLSFLRMYQALLALGSRKSARNMWSKISKEDPHVCAVIYASRAAYRNGAPVGGKKNKKKKKNAKADLRLETINILSNLEVDNK